jgi:hypothetical protein
MKAYFVAAHHTSMYIDTVELSDSYIQGCDVGILNITLFAEAKPGILWILMKELSIFFGVEPHNECN